MKRILLVEDDRMHELLTTRALKSSGVPVHLTVARDGEEAISQLMENVIKPSLILLDLNLPKMNGFEVLKKIRADASLHSIPVAIFSTSTLSDDVRRGYDLGANAYVSKQPNFAEYKRAVSVMANFWMHVNVLPY